MAFILLVKYIRLMDKLSDQSADTLSRETLLVKGRYVVK